MPPRDRVQLARALRSVTDVNGNECESEPDFALADRILNQGNDLSRAKTPGSLPPGQGVPPWPPSAEAKDACCDNDERRLFNGEFMNALLFSELGCTAFFISPSLALTAAHCVYDTVVDDFFAVTDGFAQSRIVHWRLAVGGARPYKRPTCFQVHVPSAFRDAKTKEEAPEHDYAVIDFSTSHGPCPDPEPAPMWLGSWVASNEDLREGQSWTRFGYPRWVHQGGGPIAGPGLADQYYSILGNWVDAKPWYIFRNKKEMKLTLQGPFIRHNLDASKGDSGSPTLVFDGLGWYAVGIHVGSNQGTLRDRRFDWTVHNWVAGKKPF